MDTMELLSRFADPEALETLTTMQRLMAGLITTALGMGITFIALIVLQLVMAITARFTAVQNIAEPVAQPDEQVAADIEQGDNNEELVAAITVALALQLRTAASNIVISNIRRVEDHSPVWSKVGLAEQMNTNA